MHAQPLAEHLLLESAVAVGRTGLFNSAGLHNVFRFHKGLIKAMLLDSLRALIVDDQPFALQNFCQMFGASEHVFMTAGSVEEALAIAYVNVSFRKKDGIEVARWLRDVNRRCAVLLFTGVSLEPGDCPGTWPCEMNFGQFYAKPGADPDRSQEMQKAQGHSCHIHAVGRTVERSHTLILLSMESIRSGRECLQRASQRLETSYNRLRAMDLTPLSQEDEE